MGLSRGGVPAHVSRPLNFAAKFGRWSRFEFGTFTQNYQMSSKQSGLHRTIAVDFDGVIASYDGWRGPKVLGDPREDVVEALCRLSAEGWKIVVYSTRGEDEIGGYLARHAIPFDEINRNSDYQTKGVKPVADVYWDDRAFRYSGDARNDLKQIRNFRTWSGRE